MGRSDVEFKTIIKKIEERVLKLRELFTIDLKNYKENGTVGKRPSVRGVIIKNGKIAMMHSLKYDYYKLRKFFFA